MMARAVKSFILYAPNSKNLILYRLGVQIPLPNLFQLGLKSKMKMYLEQRRQAMLQLHLSDKQFYCPPSCDLYWMFNGDDKE